MSKRNDAKEEIAEYVQQSTQAQGIPEKVTDPTVIAKLQVMCATLSAPDQG